jgi:NTE family protein
VGWAVPEREPTYILMMDKVIAVFGGGGVKGMAHAGAWRAIEEAGLTVSELIGTSIGGLVAAGLAGGVGWRELYERANALKKQDIVAMNRWALLLNGIRQQSVFQAEPLQSYIDSVLPVQNFDELEMPVSMNAVDLETGRMEWFGAAGRMDVPLRDAVYATCALPLFYPPAQIDGTYYVDGGVRDSLPVQLAAERGASLIIAVDVGAGEVRDSGDTVAKGLVAIHHRVTEIMGFARKRQVLENWAGPPLLYIRPPLDGYSTFDFGQTGQFLEEGYRSTRDALIEAGLSKKTPRRSVAR